MYRSYVEYYYLHLQFAHEHHPIRHAYTIDELLDINTRNIQIHNAFDLSNIE